ncbi:MAG: High-affinity branched-chain amino acid transport system permease protein LivH [Candidatus Heimdallarchaeota archaeon LC_3]|nr:MAG: High-affinity branched-chain amino acid transport system permease protein LivH [Candidatus Heimdallarchaeota archaeon LC_3]
MQAIGFDILQNISQALFLSGLLILLTIGLNMIYSVMKFSNFAHAEWVTFGMYIGWWGLQLLYFWIPWDNNFLINNIFVHAMFAFVMVGLFGILGEILIYSRLRNTKAGPTSFVVASIGIGLIVRNLLSMIFSETAYRRGTFGGRCPNCTQDANLPGFFPSFLHNDVYEFVLFNNDSFFGTQSILITKYEFFIIILAIVMVFAVDFLFRRTKFGIAMRATSDSRELAQISGINTKRIVLYTWFIAGGITGFGATFYRANLPKFDSFTGFLLLLPIFAVVILGGVGSFRGGIIAALIYGFVRQAFFIILTEFQKDGGIEDMLSNIEIIPGVVFPGITFHPSYADAIGFVILILVLLFRPQGISGKVEATRARV